MVERCALNAKVSGSIPFTGVTLAVQRKPPKFSITKSAMIELNILPSRIRMRVGDAILYLRNNPEPKEARPCKGIAEGCSYISVDDHYILYFAGVEELVVLGVLNGAQHPIH